jgi:hypothetical protein
MSIKSQLAKLTVTKLKMGNGETYGERLKREVNRLYDCIQKRIDEYYNSYTPIKYKRTYRFHDALYAENLVDIRVEGNQFKLSLRFHPDLAQHETWTSKGNGFVPILLNYGFRNHTLENYLGLEEPVEHLTYLEPQLFIENGILDWNRENSLGSTIDVTAIYNG